MKKIGLFVWITVILACCCSSENSVDIAQAQSVIEAAQIVAQGVSDVGCVQTLILVLITLIFATLFILAVYLIVRRLIRIRRVYRKLTSGKWISGPNAHWKKSEEPDLYQQMLIEQQWLWAQLLSQGHEDAADTHDPLGLPHDGWG